MGEQEAYPQNEKSLAGLQSITTESDFGAFGREGDNLFVGFRRASALGLCPADNFCFETFR